MLTGWDLLTTLQHLGSGQRSLGPPPGSSGSGLVLGQWGHASGPARLVLEVVVSEGQHVWRSDDVPGASRVSCVSTAVCTARVPVTTAAHRAAAFSPGVWWGGSAFRACAPHSRAAWCAGRRPAPRVPAQIRGNTRPAGRGHSIAVGPTGAFPCLSGWSTCSRSRAGPQASWRSRSWRSRPGKRRRRCRTSSERSCRGGHGLWGAEGWHDPVPPPSLQSAPGGGLAGRQAGQPRLGQDLQRQRESQWPGRGQHRSLRPRPAWPLGLLGLPLVTRRSSSMDRFGGFPAGTSRQPGQRPHSPRPTPTQTGLFVCLQFEGGRSTEEIRKFWQNHEHPSINKQEWSEQEVAQLKAVAAKHGHLDWLQFADS